MRAGRWHVVAASLAPWAFQPVPTGFMVREVLVREVGGLVLWYQLLAPPDATYNWRRGRYEVLR